VTARLVGLNEKQSRRRAFCLALIFVLQPSIGRGVEETNKGVSSEAFETFLRAKNIIPSSAPEPTNGPAQIPTATQSVPSPSDKTPPVASVPQPASSVASSNTSSASPTGAFAPVGPTVPIADTQIPVAVKTENNAANSSVSPLASVGPSSTSPGHDTDALSSQPGVELFVPNDSDDLPTFEWGGCWWEKPHARDKQLITRDANRVQFIDLEQLIWLSVQHSPAIQAMIKVPSIQRSEEDLARADFDPRFNARSNFKDTSDPVGNTLTTGGPNRLNEYFWENSVGISDRNTIGGKSELRQAMDARDSNSLFFVPGDQVDTKLSLNYTQPLRRGYGAFYNTSQIQIQQSKTQQEIATLNEGLQNHAMKLHNAYWSLVASRFRFVQALNTQHRLEDIHKRLSDRKGIDLLSSHIKRVEKEIETLKSLRATLKAQIKSTQFEIAHLVAAPELQADLCSEIIPLTLPTNALPPDELLMEEYYSAILYRGDLARVRFKIEQVAIQKRVAIHELQSKLDLTLETYVRGLEGDKRLLDSLTRQFDSGAPSYAAGLVYEAPKGNRAAKANVFGNSESLAQLTYEYSDNLQKAFAQVNSAVEKSKGSYRAIFASLNAANAAVSEVELHQTRYEDYFSENASRSVILSEWLDSEMRLFSAERELAEQQVEHMKHLTQIKFESGTLLTIQAE
jgi:outer membrane protein TolC